MNPRPDIKAKSGPEWTTLYDHLVHVSEAAVCFASYLGMDERLARLGGILHDIGKAHPVFQDRLHGIKHDITIRHELSSLLFLPLFDRVDWVPLTAMVVAHHKSAVKDVREKGLLDLLDTETNTYINHLGDWGKWQPTALEILQAFGISTRHISTKETQAIFEWVVEYCENKTLEDGYSEWRGLLVGADHFASALIDETLPQLPHLFKRPNLKVFERRSDKYPLSLKLSDSVRPHTLVVASTGAGKTDYLFRRCRGRVFYMLPFQASSNAMYYRLKHFLSDDNPDLELRMKHGASKLHAESKLHRSKEADESIQSLFGAAVKVLTPFQVAAIALANKGYEAILLDLRGCDIIMDEVHTYDGKAQGIVLKVIEVLASIGCRVHVGTATMPTALFEGIRDILGSDKTLEVRLTQAELDQYNRHTVIKSNEACTNSDKHFLPRAYLDRPELQTAIDSDQKVLLICNQVAYAQKLYLAAKDRHPEVSIMLLHSRFKRGDRAKLESRLLGLDRAGNETNEFNTSDKACIVVSTQVVEVSIDISFDLLITDCAPLDSLIQRFGRVNRKRLHERRNVVVLHPPEDEKAGLPYEADVLQRTYAALPNGTLNERDIQGIIDEVYPTVTLHNINAVSIFRHGAWEIGQMMNQNESLVKLLDIDAATCIVDSDIADYKLSRGSDRMPFEFSLRYWTVQDCSRLEYGSEPFVIASAAYDSELGVDTTLITAYETII